MNAYVKEIVQKLSTDPSCRQICTKARFYKREVVKDGLQISSMSLKDYAMTGHYTAQRIFKLIPFDEWNSQTVQDTKQEEEHESEC